MLKVFDHDEFLKYNISNYLESIGDINILLIIVFLFDNYTNINVFKNGTQYGTNVISFQSDRELRLF